MTAAVPHVRWALLALLVLLTAPLGAQSSPGSTPRRSVADGVFTQEQAQRGETTFRSTCAACHTLGDFTGEVFLKRWSTVGSLFEVVSTTMPQDLPGTLSAQQYAELLAYILSRNNFPAGSTELPGEVERLNAIAILPPRD
jgi:mono/diheme cytochrome c family protein